MEGVRQIRRGHRGNRGRIHAPKAGGRAEFESTLERDFYYLLQCSSEVERFHPQPVALSYVGGNGRKKRYVPDTLVYYRDGQSPCLFEVKHVAELLKDRAEYRLRFRAARAYAREQGWRFSTVTERAIRGVVLDNITFLRQFLDPDREFDPAHLEFLRQNLTAPTTPRTLLASLPLTRKGVLLPALWHLVATGEIQTDLGERLTMDSMIWRAA